ncbi:MAG: DUF933 domain-containing protein [bacterium]|nr:DUF933 domain-containing protein [bacterium]
MNIGIIGLPQTGKKTLFELLVGAGSVPVQTDVRKAIRGVADVMDPRFDRLIEMYSPKKKAQARIDIVLPSKIEEGSVSEGDIFRDLADVEVFCHVVRAFEDDAVYHVSGSLDPVRDVDYVNTEFILHDLVFLEKRLERLEKDLSKVKSESGERERDFLRELKKVLDEERPLRRVDIAPKDEKIIRSYPLLSRREMIVVLNVGDEDVADTQRVTEMSQRYAPAGIRIVAVAARLESEIASLETEDEREEFMTEMGVQDTALHRLAGQCVDALGLISFFTVSSDEVRQWFVRKGANAVEAAGKIHSDLARGFIRAEVIKYEDLVEIGSEEKVKAAGKLAVKGKDYIVNDGDTLYIRFNV